MTVAASQSMRFPGSSRSTERPRVVVRPRHARWQVALERDGSTPYIYGARAAAIDRALELARALAESDHCGVHVVVERADGTVEDLVFVGWRRERVA